jgi:hypothetical protein
VAIFIGGWNLLSLFPEYLMVKLAFDAFPVLQGKPVVSNSVDGWVSPSTTVPASSSLAPVNSEDQGAQLIPASNKTCLRTATQSCATLRSGWHIYARQSVFPAALALALLYVSTIAFGSIMTVFLNWAGIPIFILAAARGFGAVFGVLATLTFEP